ncbi:MAG: hypothetical protein KF754_00345 [Planctomycetes bacterium]|nr:hypothetical protein [Planctomycetota bacterium]
MRKDRLVLVLLLTMFALLGAECRSIGQKDAEERKLPKRALAAGPLLRTYYDTITTPAGMYDIKIPEDKDDLAKNGPLTIEFEMAGLTVVTDVRCRMRIAPPESGNGADCELQCRIVAPDGTTSTWKDVDFASDELINPGVEMIFLNEFDGLTAAGLWKIQLKDAVDDKDGRCVFRNGTLRINFGLEGNPTNPANETATLALNSTSYTYLSEHRGVRDLGDWGYFGLDVRPLRADFSFTGTSFFVRSFSLTLSIFARDSIDLSADLYMLLVAPNGAWQFMRPDTNSTTASFQYGSQRLTTLVFNFGGSAITAPSFPFQGQPSAGTWSLFLWDVNVDSNIMRLSKDELRIISVPDGMGGFVDTLTEFPDTPAQLVLAGVN